MFACLSKIVLSLSLVTVLVFQLACAGMLKRLDDNVFPYVPSVVTVIVNRHLISPELGDKIKDDFNSGLTDKQNAETALENIKNDTTLTDHQKKYQSYLVYANLLNQWREIVARNHFSQANNSTLNEMVGLVTDILTILSNRSAKTAGVELPRNASLDTSDSTLKSKVKRLEQLVRENSK